MAEESWMGSKPPAGGHTGKEPSYKHFAESVTSGKNIKEVCTTPGEASPSPPQVDWDQIRGIARTYESRGELETARFNEHQKTEPKSEKKEEREEYGAYGAEDSEYEHGSGRKPRRGGY